MLYRCQTNYFCCGITTDEHGIVIEAAPIMKWVIGRHYSYVRSWLLSKSGKIEEVSITVDTIYEAIKNYERD